jgi:hypothetical protein
MNTFLKSTLWTVLVGCALASCTQEQNTDPEDEKQLDANLVLSPAAYTNALTERHGDDDVTFKINNVRRKESTLYVAVEGGCSEDSFKFIWDGTIAESYPMQIHMVLVHDSAEAPCPAINQYELKLDLTKLLEANTRWEDYVFHVANGSVRQDTSLNPDGSITNRP